MSLLENFYQPQQGLVLLDGKPVHTLRHDYLHSKVSLCPQDEGPSRLKQTEAKQLTVSVYPGRSFKEILNPKEGFLNLVK